MGCAIRSSYRFAGAHSSPRVVCLYFTTKAAASQGQELAKKDLLLPVDKTARRGYNKNDIIKLAVKRRVGLRIDLYQRAWTVRAGGEQGAENGLGAARARGKSAKPATGAPVTASGCRAMGPPCRRSIEAVPRKGAVNQGGTTEAFCSRPCRFFGPVGAGVFLFRPGPSPNFMKRGVSLCPRSLAAIS